MLQDKKAKRAHLVCGVQVRFVWLVVIVAVSYNGADGQDDNTCLDNSQYMRSLNLTAPRFNDQDNFTEFTPWGYVCCKQRADIDSFRAEIHENVTTYELDGSCNGPADFPGNKIEVQVRKRDDQSGSPRCSGDAEPYVPCEIWLKGDLKGYLNRRRPCMYNPVISLACDLTPDFEAFIVTNLPTENVSIIDKNTAPQWSSPAVDLGHFSEYSSVGTWLLIPQLDDRLSVAEADDIWGSANWNVTLSIRGKNGVPSAIADAVDINTTLTIYPNATSFTGDGRTLPALQLNRQILYDEFCQFQEPPCVLEFEVVATDGGGMVSFVPVTLEVVDENNHPPIFTVRPTSPITLNEDDPDQLSRLPQLTARDGDTGINCSILYTLDKGQGTFTIDGKSGRLSFKSGITGLSWYPEGPNQYFIVARVAEDPATPSRLGGQCSDAMYILTTLTVEVTSRRSEAAVIGVSPEILTVLADSAATQDVGDVIVSRNGALVPVGNLSFSIRAERSPFSISPTGHVIKKEGDVVHATTVVRVEIKDLENRLLNSTDLTIVAEPAKPITFTELLYERHVNESTSSGTETIFSFTEEVADCPSCSCSLTAPPARQGVTLSQIGGNVTASLRDTAVFSAGSYQTFVDLLCVHPDTAQRAEARLLINWHPRPKFDELPPIYIDEGNASLGLTIATLRPRHQFPYELTYTVNEDAGVDINPDGTVTVSYPFDYTVEKSHEFTVNVWETGSSVPPSVVTGNLTILEAFRPARFTNAPAHAIPVSCGTDGYTVKIDRGTERGEDVKLLLSSEGEFARCVIVEEQSFFSKGYVKVVERPGSNCQSAFSVQLALQSDRSRDIAILNFSGCPERQTPSFSHPNYERDVFQAPSESYPLTVSPSVTDCPSCECTKEESASSHDALLRVNSSTGAVTITGFPSEDAPVNGSYSSRLVVKCQIESDAPLDTRTSILINWHPKPMFDVADALTVSDDAVVDAVLAVLRPANQFPYSLRYESSNPSVVTVTDNGVVRLARQVNYTAEKEINIIVRVYEEKRRDIDGAVVTIPLRITVADSFRPASFTNQSTAGTAVTCSGSGAAIPFDLGSESARDVTLAVEGEYGRCVRVMRVDGQEFVTITDDDAGLCGASFSVTLVLRGRRSRDIAVVKFSGCLEIVPPTFSQLIYEEPVYSMQLTNAIPLSVSQPVTNCTNCTCLFDGDVTPTNFTAFIRPDSKNGSIEVNTFPSNVLLANEGYRSRVAVRCWSGQTGVEARTVVIINWHPVPHFGPQATITTRDDTMIGSQLAVIRPQYQFPYQLHYDVDTPDTSIARLDSDGVIFLNRPLTQADIREHVINVTVSELTRPENAATVSLTIVVTDSFRPARFSNATAGSEGTNITCGDNGVTFLIDVGSEKPEDIVTNAPGYSQSCVSVIMVNSTTPTTLVYAVVTGNMTGTCGPTFAAVILLRGSRSTDIITVNFVDCPNPVTDGITAYPTITPTVVPLTAATVLPIDTTTIPPGEPATTSISSTEDTSTISTVAVTTQPTTTVPPYTVPAESTTTILPAVITTSPTITTIQLDSTTTTTDIDATTAILPVNSDTTTIPPDEPTTTPSSTEDTSTISTVVVTTQPSITVPPFTVPAESTTTILPAVITTSPTVTTVQLDSTTTKQVDATTAVLPVNTDTTTVSPNEITTVNTRPGKTDTTTLPPNPITTARADETSTVLPGNTNTTLPAVNNTTSILVASTDTTTLPSTGVHSDDTTTPLSTDTTLVHPAESTVLPLVDTTTVPSLNVNTTTPLTENTTTVLPNTTITVNDTESDTSVSSGETTTTGRPDTTRAAVVTVTSQPQRSTQAPPASNLLSILDTYQQNFDNDTAEFFGFDSAAKEIQIKEPPPPGKNFSLKFDPPGSLPGVSRRRRQIFTEASGYVLTLRTLNWPTAVIPVLTAAEIALIVVGSALLLAVIALIGFAITLRRYKATLATHAPKPTGEAPSIPIKPILGYEEANTYINSSAQTGTAKSHRSISVVGSLSNHLRIGTGSTRSETEHPYGRLHLNGDDISNTSSHTDVDMLEPTGEYPVMELEHIEVQQATILPSVEEREEDPEPDYPLDVATTQPELEEFVAISPVPPPPPPPPIFIPTHTAVDSPNALPAVNFVIPIAKTFDAPPTPVLSPGLSFMSELKKAVADPYTVLRVVDEETVPDSPDRKVRFDADVEVFNSRTSSPVGTFGRSSRNAVYESPLVIRSTPTTEAFTPPIPAYSALLRQNLERDWSPKPPITPPVPAYVSSASERAANPPASIVSPSPPTYRSTVLTADFKPTFSSQTAATDDMELGDLKSRRQSVTPEAPAPPPPAPPPPPMYVPLVQQPLSVVPEEPSVDTVPDATDNGDAVPGTTQAPADNGEEIQTAL